MAKMMCSWLLVAVAICLSGEVLPRAEAARILVVIAMPAPSHVIVFAAMTRALADRGHQITLVTTMPKDSKLLPTKNHVIVSVSNQGVDDFKNQAVIKFLTGNNKGTSFWDMINFGKWGPMLVRATLDHPDFKAEVGKPGQKYDLVVTEAFFMQESMLGLGHKFNAPVVALLPFGTSPIINEIMGNSNNPSWVPNMFLGLSDRMSFTERVLNTLSTFGMTMLYRYQQLPMQQELVTEYFPDAPPLVDMLHDRLALTLVNNHYSLVFPQPLAPGVVEVGGMHIADTAKPLPKDLKTFFDEAKEGVVYFSMGSNLLMEYVPQNKTDAMFKALSSLKERVLMKWDGPVPKDLSANIRIIKWAPQADILAQPNLRVFVTHGGLLSTQESVFHGVPLVGIPVFADQNFNMNLATKKGFCEQVTYAELTADKLSAALAKVLGSPKYKEAAQELSRLFRSKPMRPADQAVFWVEHVMQYGGRHLRPSSVQLPLYQLLLLDVAAALLLPLLLLLLLVRAICRWCCCRRGAGKSSQEEEKKGKKKKQ